MKFKNLGLGKTFWLEDQAWMKKGATLGVRVFDGFSRFFEKNAVIVPTAGHEKEIRNGIQG